ncbi:unnamed protein product [Clonostachys rosea]|uniref:DUF6604 domain-containing protein n=1 Tax=Bionectria ochroleuca TaxID=29856 RepID=A0ABY6V072_BIOOC|nr:unnamed protein product [Clonostachys rosea]
MADHNLYASYKRDQRYLVCWLVHTSNRIVVSQQDESLPINTSGQTTVSGLVVMSSLIAKHNTTIPVIIFRLLESIIDARTQAHRIFEKMAGSDPDPELARSNTSHRHFIDVLQQTFEILGGLAWKSASDAGQRTDEEENIEDLIFSNKFSTLNVGVESGDDSDEEAELPNVSSTKRRHGKGKKSKGKGKKSKGKNKKRQETATPQANLEDLPLESYKIVEDFNAGAGDSGRGLLTDYLMDVYYIFRNILVLRSSIQDKWNEVAYEELNSAVAGAVSNVAIATIKKMQSTIFVEFPGNDSFDAILNAITRGNPEKLRDNFQVGMVATGPGRQPAHMVHDTYLDIEEQFLMHSYKDFCDFVTDFRLNRTGKPTKRMQAEIGNWNPKLNLADATKEERIKWRRAYTINWLYDLVNIFSSVVVQRNNLKGENHDLAKIDWSSTGPWNSHRRIFGLNDFAAFVSSLSWQKPGAAIKSRILPNHVFQLQCIVDSWTVSRGWSLNFVRGHVLRRSSHNFVPRRDLDAFLGRDSRAGLVPRRELVATVGLDHKIPTGVLRSEPILEEIFERDGIRRGNPELHAGRFAVVERIRDEFDNWLGQTKYMSGLDTIPPSRFSNTNANGLYEYSPFQCGVGLLEALDLTYQVGTYIWDQVPEPAMLVHLHNMIVKKGYLEKPVELWHSIEQVFAEAMFPTGKPPTSKFAQTFMSHSKSVQARSSSARSMKVKSSKNGTDMAGLLDLRSNVSFKSTPYINLLSQADWDPDRITDEEIPLETITCMLRLSQLQMKKDGLTSKSPLWERAKARGCTEEFIAHLSLNNPWQGDEATEHDSRSKEMLDKVRRTHPEFFKGKVTGDQEMRKKNSPGGSMNPEEMMELCGWDVYNSVCGDVPVLGLSFIWVTVSMYVWFEMLEHMLKEARNPVYVSAYEDPTFRGDRRNRLVMLALEGQNEECMKIIAELFEQGRDGFRNNMYWSKSEGLGDRTARMKKGNKAEEPACVLM